MFLGRRKGVWTFLWPKYPKTKSRYPVNFAPPLMIEGSVLAKTYDVVGKLNGKYFGDSLNFQGKPGA